MIQCFGLNIDETNKDLFMPVSIGKFEFFAVNESNSTMFAHAVWESSTLSGIVTLYDETGKLLAKMNQIRLVRTTIIAFQNIIKFQAKKLPDMYELIWRSRDGPLQSRVDLSLCPSPETIRDTIRDKQDIRNFKKVLQYMPKIKKVVANFALKILAELGWNPSIGSVIDTHDIVAELIVSTDYQEYVNRLLEIMSESEIMVRKNSTRDLKNFEWHVVQCIPSVKEISYAIETIGAELTSLFDLELVEFPVASFCSKQAPSILQSKISAVSALFSENRESDITDVYNKTISASLANSRMNDFVTEVVSKTVLPMDGKLPSIRILEVGAGSGGTTTDMLKILHKHRTPFRYTFTDISHAFLESASQKFKDTSNISFGVLNIDKDPKEQGFAPHQFDIIIASNVIHATPNIVQSILNMKQLLVPKGLLLLQELVEPVPALDLMFGLFHGYWSYNDFELRPSYPFICFDKWQMVLNDCGFACSRISPDDEFNCIIAAQVDPQTYPEPMKQDCVNKEIVCWLLFWDKGSKMEQMVKLKLEQEGENVITVEMGNEYKQLSPDSFSILQNADDNSQIELLLAKISESFNSIKVIYFWGLHYTDQKLICGNLLSISKPLLRSTETLPQLFIVTRGAVCIGDQGSVNPAASTLHAVSKSCKFERVDMQSTAIDLDPNTEANPEDESCEIFSELWLKDYEYQIGFRGGKKFIVRLSHVKASQSDLQLPSKDRYTLVIPTTKSINDITFDSATRLMPLDDQVEIAVKAVALNFRDIFVIMRPDEYHTLYDTVGSDFSGVITAVGNHVTKFKAGDKVVGLSPVTAVASHVTISADCIFHKPAQFTFPEACTLPAVFITAYYCLINVSKLLKNETILIHVASGGVGLIAIQIARCLGANIITTAGSKRKRRYLRSLGIKNVFHSRDTSFGEAIESGTDGVDVVLNSLTGPGFKETTLKVCKPNARFVEIGKVGIWKPDDVRQLRPDVQYTIVDVEKLTKSEQSDLMLAMEESAKENKIKPLPYTRFDVSQTHDALNYFLKAHHIGKVVVTMSELKSVGGKYLTNALLFNEDSTYMITGGLGGIGLEVGHWMLTCGAKHIVLVGRHAPDSKTLELLKRMNDGSNVITMEADIGNFDHCQKLLQEITELELPQIRGVMHAAGVLADGVITNQTWENFETTFNAKVRGSWNLHQLTKHYALEHFVLFSSAAASVGCIAQCNHSAANMYLDSLAHYRHSIGLPAQSINWGAWGEIGVAIKSVFGRDGALGIRPFSKTQGIDALKYIMSRPCTQMSVIDFDVKEILQFMPSSANLLSELSGTGDDMLSNEGTEMLWNEMSLMGEEDRSKFIQNLLERSIRQILKLPKTEVIDEFQTFSEMGMDSLMAVEMRNRLQTMFGKRLTLNATSLLDYPSVSGLSKYLAGLTMTVDSSNVGINSVETSKNPEAFKDSEFMKILEEDFILPEHIQSVGPSNNSSDIKNILLTGATGHLGVYILQELCSLKHIKIHCLIRGSTAEAAKKKLTANLKRFNMINLIDMKSISIVLGDISKSKFGVSESEYALLAANVDAIIHCAARTSHIEPYRKSKNDQDIRSVNVIGTIRVLELASMEKTKHVFFPSSFTAANQLTSDKFIYEEFPDKNNKGEGIVMGYSLTKFVCEKLMKQAIERGIPCKVFRFNSLGGNSETGFFYLNNDHYMGMLLTSAKLGMVPDISGGYHALPVDVGTKISIQIFFSNVCDAGLYNIFQPKAGSPKDFIKVAAMVGKDIRLVDSAEFNAAVQAQDGDSFLSAFKEFYSEDGIKLVSSAVHLGLESDQALYRFSPKILQSFPQAADSIPEPSVSLKLCVDFARSSGLFKSIGLDF